MAIQSDALSRNLDFFRDLGTTFLSSTKDIAAWQLESMHASITRSGQQLRAVWSDTCSVQEPTKWPDTVQSGIRNAIKINRDSLIATTDYQMETMRLLQDMGNEMRQILTQAMNEQLVNIDVAASREKRKPASHLTQQSAAA